MQRARRHRVVGIALGMGLAGFIALSACSNYGEGERCEHLNNNDDCADGLQCLLAAQVNEGYKSSDRCCPPDRATATHPACTVVQVSVGGDSAPPAETGPTPDATTDAAEASTVEAGPDAAADADASDGD